MQRRLYPIVLSRGHCSCTRRLSGKTHPEVKTSYFCAILLSLMMDTHLLFLHCKFSV